MMCTTERTKDTKVSELNTLTSELRALRGLRGENSGSTLVARLPRWDLGSPLQILPRSVYLNWPMDRDAT
jgi:hypothetical protein